MAYNVSENYRTVVYSGEALYDCKLYINNNLIPINQISSINISSPIIDTTSEGGSMFHIGTFISQKLDIQFKNLDGLDLENNPSIDLEIGLKVGNSYEYIPIGKYLIDELSEDYQTTCLITCFDYAIKFNSNLDISQFFDEDNKIYASDLFEAICGYYGVNVGTYPEVNNDKPIYYYDNTITAKRYIMYLAELFGGNAKMERDGSCSIIPLKNYTDIEIDGLSSKSFKVGATYEITRVCYDNGKSKYQAGGNVISVDELPSTNIDINSYYYLTPEMKYYKYINSQWTENTDIKNTLYLRTDNLFITQQTDINAIYEAVKNFAITNIMCENRMDLSLDCWDIIKYTLDDNVEYYTFYDNTINYNGVTMGKVNVNVPLKTIEETTNIIAPTQESKIRNMQTTINEQELSITTIIQEIGDRSGKETSITQDIDSIEAQVKNSAVYKTEVEGYTQIHLEDAEDLDILRLEIDGNAEYKTNLVPSTNLYPASSLQPNMEGSELR